MLTKLRYDLTILNYPLTPRAHSSYARIHHGRHTRSPVGRCAGHFFVNTISMSKASKQVRLHALKSGPLVKGLRGGGTSGGRGAT